MVRGSLDWHARNLLTSVCLSSRELGRQEHSLHTSGGGPWCSCRKVSKRIARGYINGNIGGVVIIIIIIIITVLSSQRVNIWNCSRVFGICFQCILTQSTSLASLVS